MPSCHGPTVREGRRRLDGSRPPVIALAGNPNVGKSTIFNRLTGLHATTAHYPGKTVEVGVATVSIEGREVRLVDLPGTYGLSAASEDQWAARRAVLDSEPDAVVVIVDATNLARNLYLVLQLLDLGLPVVVALNLMDQAQRAGLRTNARRLEQLLRVPVVPTVAHRGLGVRALMTAAIHWAGRGDIPPPCYSRPLEAAVSRLAAALEPLRASLFGGSLSARGLALLLLEGDEEITSLVQKSPEGADVLEQALALREELSRRFGQPSAVVVADARHRLAAAIVGRCQRRERLRALAAERLWRYTTANATGLPILAAVLVGLFAFLFQVGGFLSERFDQLWGTFVSPLLQEGVSLVLGAHVAGRILLWGVDAGINASLAVGIPYVLTFYFILALLEDTGYLNAAAFLSDNLMRRLGLHGRAILPLIAGAGCNVPAVIGTRVLASRRERFIASTLIVLTPCSARTAVIMGSVALFVGWGSALAVYGLAAAVMVAVGWGLHRLLPGRPPGLVMEVFPPRMPSLRTVLTKTWFRFKDFVFQATPIV
ncbi:MAG: ferrous iron transport protein B, partial [Chloroflexota bacterium]|nr:ferrous iron transport protein B [Chloroflexota bacterium]